MENNEDFLDKLRNLKKPNVMTEHQDYIKLPLLNAKKSAALGWWLVILPSFFLICAFMRFHLGIGKSLFDSVSTSFQSLEKAHGWWFSPLLFFILPLVAVAMNLLSVLHIIYDKTHKELIISIKLRFLNIVLIIIGMLIVFSVSLYVITEHLVHIRLNH